MRSVRVEDRAIAAGDGGEGLPVDGGEMVVLREGVDRQFPVDGAVEDLLAQWRPPPDAPGVELAGQRSQVRGDVQAGTWIHCDPEEPGELRGRKFGQAVGVDGHFREPLTSRKCHQPPGVVVRPRVVRTGEPLRVAAPRHHLRLPM